MLEDLVLVKWEHLGRTYAAWPVSSDYLVSRYPVSELEYARLVGSSPDGEASPNHAQRATWAEAIRFCNLLSREHGLPPAYDEASYVAVDATGQPIEDVLETHGFRLAAERLTGFRLASCAEWECAAMGIAPNAVGFYLEILARIYYIWGMDPASREPPENPKLCELVANPIGLYGMLENTEEWCSSNNAHDWSRNVVSFWRYYFTNYNNDISYSVQSTVRAEPEVRRFRVVVTSRK